MIVLRTVVLVLIRYAVLFYVLLFRILFFVLVPHAFIISQSSAIGAIVHPLLPSCLVHSRTLYIE